MTQERRHAVRNISSNIALFAVQTGVALMFTRFLVHSLGVTAYGMVPLANSLIPYLTLASVGLSASLGRHFTVAWASGDRDAAAAFMNTAFSVSIIAVLIALILGSVLSVSALRVLDIPPEMRVGAGMLFAAVTMSAALTVGRSLSAVVPFSEGRIDTDNIATLLDVFVRIALVVGAFCSIGPSLDFVAYGIFAGALAGLSFNVITWRKIAPWLAPRFVRPNLIVLRELLGTSLWVLVNQVGSILFLATDLVVINLLLGPSVGGRYGSVMLWATFLRGLAGALSNFLTPLMVRTYAAGDRASMVHTAASAVKCVGLALALPVGLVSGFAAPILRVWLGAEFVQMTPVLIALVLHLCVNLAVVPLYSIQISHNRLKVPGISTVLAGVVNIGLSILLAKTWPNALGVALATAIALTAKNAFFLPWYVARVQNAPATVYLVQLLPVVGMTSAVFVVAEFFVRFGVVDGVTGIMGYGALIAVVYVTITWSLFLTRAERSVFTGVLPWKVLAAGEGRT